MSQQMPSVIRVAYPHAFPAVSSECKTFPTLVASPRCTLPGQLVEIISLIANELNLQIETVPLPEIQLNLSIPHGLQMMEENKIDTIALGFQQTEDRSRKFSFTNPIYKIQSRLLMKKHDNVYAGIGGFLNTYQTQTWLIMLTVLTVQCIMAILIRRVESQMNRTNKTNVLESIWQMISLQLMKPEKVAHFKSIAGNFSTLIFSFQCVLVFGILSSCILSNILHAGSYESINSIDTLIRQIISRNKYLVSTTPNNWFYEQINQSKIFPYNELHDALRKNPLRISTSVEETLRRVIKGRAIVFIQEGLVICFISFDYKFNDDDETAYKALEHCNLIDIYSELPKMSTHLLMRKNSSFLEAFNQVINNNMAQIMRICRKYIEAKKRLPKCDKLREYKPLGLFPYIGTLIVCAGMFVLATGILLAEIMHDYMRRQGIERPKLLDCVSKLRRKKVSNTLCLEIC